MLQGPKSKAINKGGYFMGTSDQCDEKIMRMQKELRRAKIIKWFALTLIVADVVLLAAVGSRLAGFVCFLLAVLGLAGLFAFVQYLSGSRALARELAVEELHRNSAKQSAPPIQQDQSSTRAVEETSAYSNLSEEKGVSFSLPQVNSLASIEKVEDSSLTRFDRTAFGAVHPDIAGLLYTSANGGPVSEPSCIVLFAQIAEDDTGAEPLPYYPSFSKMTPKQRTRYLKFLSDPYDPKIEIGYVFVLYYGLERGLLERQEVPRVVEVIQKLFLAHDHAGFRGYAANTLIYICSKCGLMTSIQVPVQSYADALPLVYLQAKLFGYLPAATLIAYSGAWGFSNQRYIKLYSDLFRSELEAVLTSQHGSPVLPVEAFSDDLLPRGIFPAYANYSFPAREVELPNLFRYPPVASRCAQALSAAHESVKKVLAKQRHDAREDAKAQEKTEKS